MKLDGNKRFALWKYVFLFVCITFCSSWIRVLWCQKFLCDTLRRILIKRNPWEDSLARLDEVMGHFFMHFVPWKKTESLLKLYIWSKAKLICLLVPHSQTYTVNSLCKLKCYNDRLLGILILLSCYVFAYQNVEFGFNISFFF